MKLRCLSLKLIGALSFIGASQLVNAAGPDAGDILRQQQEIERYKSLPKSVPKSVVTEAPKSVDQKPVVKILVRGFRFEGDLKSVPEDKLQWLVQEFIGKDLSFDEIKQAVARINDYYLAQGFFIAKAILPKQEVVDGIIVIQINEGKLDSKNPYKIKKGDKFLCLEDYIMDDGWIAYTKGIFYKSVVDRCITNRDGDTNHDMEDEIDFFKHFKKIEPWKKIKF